MDSHAELRQLAATAPKHILHHFSCDCALRINDQRKYRDLHLDRAIESKRLWIEGRISKDTFLHDTMISIYEDCNDLEESELHQAAWSCMSQFTYPGFFFGAFIDNPYMAEKYIPYKWSLHRLQEYLDTYQNLRSRLLYLLQQGPQNPIEAWQEDLEQSLYM